MVWQLVVGEEIRDIGGAGAGGGGGAAVLLTFYVLIKLVLEN